MDKTDRLRDYGLAFLLYEQGLGICGYELIRELFIFVKLILNSYLGYNSYKLMSFRDSKSYSFLDCLFLVGVGMPTHPIQKSNYLKTNTTDILAK